ncbi:MAG: hypothetical protein L0Z62_04075 [Gemmataceae bacterium]|nr:hypothetical protein [Gemmataceae bacterium]
MLARILRKCWFGWCVLLVMGMLVITGCKNDLRNGDSSRRDSGGCGGCGK